MFLNRLFPIVFVLFFATLIAAILDYTLLSKYLASIALLSFVITFCIPVLVIQPWQEKAGKGEIIYALVFYVIMPLAVIIWGILSGVVEKL